MLFGIPVGFAKICASTGSRQHQTIMDGRPAGLAKAAVLSRIPRLKKSSHFVVRREPSQASFVLRIERSAIVEREPVTREGDMRNRRTLPRLAISSAFAIVCASPAFSQEYRGTMQQQMACTPDVFRLCGNQIPDVNRIVACLRQNTPVLSPPCRAVFESSDSAVNPPPPNRPQPVQPPARRSYQY